MKYEDRLQKILAKWESNIKYSKYPRFERKVLQHTKKMQLKAANRNERLSLDSTFYVYVLMDPRKEGPYEYVVEDKKLLLPFEPFYVGKGKGKRLRDHNAEARRNPRPQKGEHKQNLIRKLHRLDLEPLAKKVSTSCMESVAFVKETLLIKVIGRMDLKKGPLTNKTNGGDGLSTGSHSEETRQKMRMSHLGKKQSEETIAKRAAPHRGKKKSPHTEETKARISQSRKGKGRQPKSAAHIAKVAAANRGKVRSEVVRLKISESRKGKGTGKRKPLSEEHKAKMSATKRGKKLSEAHKQKLREAQKARRAWKASQGIVRKTTEKSRAKMRTSALNRRLKELRV